ncbi:unnamed protein product [Protopolystoma xenopodis]|uniref:Uncharacterized protein n=1 Tax=Protopolystoma xenopodis TaxID=117903 RepID=A0A448XDC9_9PLAT|nr:unnamed protein product [Protopolystoma xenopodis]
MGRIGTHPATFVASSASSSPQMNTGKLYSSDSGKVVGSESLMGLRDNGGQSSNNPPSGAGAILVAIVALICAIILVLLGIIVYLCGRRGLAVWRSTGCIRPLTSGSDSSGVRQVATVGHSDGYLTAESIASAATVSDNLADRRLLRSPTGLITSESVYRELHPVHCCRQPCPITSFVLSPSEVESNGGQAAKLSYGYFTVPQTSLSQTSTSNNTTSTFLPTAFLPVTPIYRSLKEGTGEAAFEGTVGINDRSERSGSVQIRLNSPYNGLATKGIRNSLGCDVETVQNWQCPPISSFTAGRQESKETSDIAQHDYGPPCKSKSVTPGLQQKQSMLHGLYKGSAASLSEMDILQLIARINLDRNVLNKSLLLPETLADVKPTGEKEKANSKSDATNLDTYLKALSIQMLGNGRNTLPLVCNGHKQNRRLRTQEHKQVLATSTSVRRTQGGERTNGSLRSHAKVSISDSSGSRAATGSGAESADYSLSSFDVAGSEINCESELSHISQPLEQALKEARRLEILQDIKETWKNNQFLLNSSKNAKEQEQKHNWNFDLDFKRYGKQENIPLDGTNSKKRDDNIAVVSKTIY